MSTAAAVPSLHREARLTSAVGGSCSVAATSDVRAWQFEQLNEILAHLGHRDDAAGVNGVLIAIGTISDEQLSMHVFDRVSSCA